MMYNHYIKTLTDYLNNNEKLNNEAAEKIFDRISVIVEQTK